MASERFDKGRIIPQAFERPGSDIRRMGYLKKLKTNKKKFFVLRSTSSSGPARLEYYDSEKKFRNGQLPKRSIQLHTLLNINKKYDSKHKYAIALYTKDDCFSVMADDESEQEDWYALLLDYQCEYLREGDNRREHYEHVWQVTIQQKGLGTGKTLRGNFRLCLSKQSLSLFRINSDKPQVSFQLATVRSLAHHDNLFRMEVGSWAPTGAGELWMHVEDSVIAQSMHEAILNCMKDATAMSSFDESDSGRFEKRSESIAYRNRPHSQDFRPRTVSESHTQSPHRVRVKQIDDHPRPVSTVYPTNRSTSLPADTISPGTSPLMHLDMHLGPHRFRSDSAESRASRSSMLAGAEDLSPMEFLPPSYAGTMSEHSPQVIDEEDDSYFEQDFSSHDFTSISSSPAEVKTPLEEDAGQASPYMDMRPGNTTPPTATSGGGYVAMNLGSTHSAPHDVSTASAEIDAYMTMGPGRTVSEPIPIKSGVPTTTSSGVGAGVGGGAGYMDMSHSSHLPTVREGGSNEGYLPMTPNSGQSPIDSSHLRPEPAVYMLSDDASEFPKRTYSLGSRPPTKPTARIPNVHDPVPIKRGILDNDGRSCSAPHLITHRGRSLNVESPTPSASPLSMSYKSESSYRSDDSDSFMELDFHRPRTASDSHGYRPRASSFGKSPMQAMQGHRPRSSSYGQSARTYKLKHGARLGSYESVRTTSQELLHKSSIDSLSHRSSRDSLRVSSNESLRKLSEELRTKTHLLNTDYIDMSVEKRKTPSPQPPNRGRENGYMDMTLGSRTTSPSRSKSSHDSGNTSKSQSSEKLHVQGHLEDTYINVEPSEMTSSSSSGSAYINIDLQDQGQGHHARHSGSVQSQCRSDFKGSDKVKQTNETSDSYVMYEPSVKGGGHAADEGHQPVTLRHGSGSTDSLKKKSRQSGSQEKSKSRDHRRKSGVSSSKRKSHIDETRDVHVSKVIQSSHVTKRDSSAAATGDEYVEFAPAGHAAKGAPSGLKTDRSRSEPLRAESEYVGFEPGNVSSGSGLSKPQPVKSFFSSGTKSEKEPPKSASGDSRVTTSQSGLASSKSAKAQESDYVLSSPIGSTPSIPKVGDNQGDYVLSSPLKSCAPPTSGTGDASDYMVSAPVRHTGTFVRDEGKKKASGCVGDAAATRKKCSNIIPQSASSAYCNLQISQRTMACHEGTSVDPPLSNTDKLTQQNTGEMYRGIAPSGVREIPKPQSRVETVKSPSGNRKEFEGTRAKHFSGSAVTASPAPAKTAGMSGGEGELKVKDGQFLEEPNAKTLTRPGSTPAMLTLDETQSKPAATGATLSVDPNPRSRHSISDLSAYEQMTFPSNTLSSQQHSSSNTLSSQQNSSGNTLSSSQQLAASSEKVLNYASLDLGSSEAVGDSDSNLRSPRTKSRHCSAADDKGEPPLSYAQIDFEKSETLKAAAGNKDVKFTL
ncbi:insulin receptor substrate 1-B-like isoform X1 [Haliotis cracherodii]|uniref:insulin receptor substrate 1-B-like isoform X1 n=2 Tax=Haliotis cracherodii TaxID=6455 RepID=UPI0039E87E49